MPIFPLLGLISPRIPMLYGAGTLMFVFTIVTDACNPKPFRERGDRV